MRISVEDWQCLLDPLRNARHVQIRYALVDCEQRGNLPVSLLYPAAPAVEVMEVIVHDVRVLRGELLNVVQPMPDGGKPYGLARPGSHVSASGVGFHGVTKFQR